MSAAPQPKQQPGQRPRQAPPISMHGIPGLGPCTREGLLQKYEKALKKWSPNIRSWKVDLCRLCGSPTTRGIVDMVLDFGIGDAAVAGEGSDRVKKAIKDNPWTPPLQPEAIALWLGLSASGIREGLKEVLDNRVLLRKCGCGAERSKDCRDTAAHNSYRANIEDWPKLNPEWKDNLKGFRSGVDIPRTPRKPAASEGLAQPQPDDVEAFLDPEAAATFPPVNTLTGEDNKEVNGSCVPLQCCTTETPAPPHIRIRSGQTVDQDLPTLTPVISIRTRNRLPDPILVSHTISQGGQLCLDLSPAPAPPIPPLPGQPAADPVERRDSPPPAPVGAAPPHQAPPPPAGFQTVADKTAAERPASKWPLAGMAVRSFYASTDDEFVDQLAAACCQVGIELGQDVTDSLIADAVRDAYRPGYQTSAGLFLRTKNNGPGTVITTIRTWLTQGRPMPREAPRNPMPTADERRNVRMDAIREYVKAVKKGRRT